MHRTAFIAACSTLLVAGAAHAQLHDTDIAIREAGGIIETGRVDAATGAPIFGDRVFAGEFGELPDWTNDPGFDSESGAFAPDLQIGFTIQGPLLEWDGDAFTDVADERILISKGRTEIETPLSGSAVGFTFGDTGTTGRFHHHVGYELLAPAANGLYLLELTLWIGDAGVSESEPFFIVFDQNADPSELAEARQWVEDTLLGGTCAADMDGDGSLSIFDFLAFQNAFDAGDPIADFDGDGSLTLFDFLAFQNAFDAGC
ncbi:MAG: GC-type dockerin domain-anchored protein [Planctomycetota bacterium]